MQATLVDYFKSEYKKEAYLLGRMKIKITEDLVRDRLNLPPRKTFWTLVIELFR